MSTSKHFIVSWINVHTGKTDFMTKATEDNANEIARLHGEDGGYTCNFPLASAEDTESVESITFCHNTKANYVVRTVKKF